eukprot:TRINITY_DN62_c0_g1_i14.p11 TRINITY_DN62_c0_g1~~TRINITY_DN62_c0_g1_i14.p11  ORF type:complete len:109 (-),score=0.66 TRINITY_DN62_c0_g1_i14:161-487(-)
MEGPSLNGQKVRRGQQADGAQESITSQLIRSRERLWRRRNSPFHSFTSGNQHVSGDCFSKTQASAPTSRGFRSQWCVLPSEICLGLSPLSDSARGFLLAAPLTHAKSK